MSDAVVAGREERGRLPDRARKVVERGLEVVNDELVELLPGVVEELDDAIGSEGERALVSRSGTDVDVLESR